MRKSVLFCLVASMCMLVAVQERATAGLICGTTSSGGTAWHATCPGCGWWTADSCGDLTGHGGTSSAAFTGKPSDVLVTNESVSGTLTWVTGGTDPVVVEPGHSAVIPVGQPYEASYSVAFAGGLPGSGEKITIQAREDIGSGPVPLDGYVLDLGGDTFGQPAQVAYIYIDDSGQPVNTSALTMCVLPIDVNDLHGGFTTAPGMHPCAHGSINDGVGPLTNVLFLNGSAGSNPDRVINVTPTTPFVLTIDQTPAGGRRYAMYVWFGRPTVDTIRELPNRLGVSCMPTPLNPGPPQPRKRANNTRKTQLGVENWPGPPTQPAPYTLLNLAGGLRKTGTFFIQGIMFDPGAPNGKAAVTNGITVISQ